MAATGRAARAIDIDHSSLLLTAHDTILFYRTLRSQYRPVACGAGGAHQQRKSTLASLLMGITPGHKQFGWMGEILLIIAFYRAVARRMVQQ